MRVGGAAAAAASEAATHPLGQRALAGPPRDDGRQAVLPPQAARQRSEPLRRPALARPGRARVEQRKLADLRPPERRPRTLDRGRPRTGDGKLDRPARRAERRAEGEVPVDDVLRAADVRRLRIEQPRRAFPHLSAPEADDAAGARSARQHGGLQQPLEVDGRVVTRGAQRAQQAREGRRRPQPRGRQATVDDRHELDELAAAIADQPVDVRRGKCAPQRRDGRDRVHHVAQRGKPHDEQAHHLESGVEPRVAARLRAAMRIRSRVEWSLGSPTMAVRPPYACTTARSGTVSAV